MTVSAPDDDLDHQRLAAIRATLEHHYGANKIETPDNDTVDKMRALRSKVLADIEIIMSPPWRPVTSQEEP